MDTTPRFTPRCLIAPLAASSLVLSACGGGSSGPTTQGTTVDDTIADVDKASVTMTDPALAADDINRFGAELLAATGAETPGENVVVSPFSVATALGMTSLGARGTTAEEMATVLGGDPASLNDFQSSMNSLLASFDDRSWGDAQLDYANAVWGQSDYDWEPDFLDALAQQYRSEMRTADFKTDGKSAVKEINQWVADGTNDRITDLLDPAEVDPMTRMILVNAVYLKADWETPFESTSTYDDDFTTANGDTASVPTMHMTDDLDAADGDGWVAVELPYTSGGLSLVIAVPDDDSGATSETPTIDDVVGQLTSQEVNLSLPKFDIDHKTQLKPSLSTLGMPTAFDSTTADFTGMTDEQPPLYIGSVVHQANITVDEEGTEAAAATAVDMEAGSAAPEETAPPLEVDADHPFTFWLRDTETGVVLFTGNINDPQQK